VGLQLSLCADSETVSSLEMPATPHPNTLRQVEAPQPNVLVPLLCLLAAAQLPRAIDWVLTKWPAYKEWTPDHYSTFLVAFFAVGLCLEIAALVFLLSRWGLAIRSPKPAERLNLNCLWVLWPLLIYHFVNVTRMAFAALKGFSHAPEADYVRELARAHEEIWGRLAFGPSLAGVTCLSINAFTTPILEEIVFSGFVVNFGLKKLGAVAAILLSGVTFTLIHIFAFGFGLHLIPLFWAGLTYATLRVYGGSVWLALLAHWIINAAVFLPKWMVAILHFSNS
jgi:membrane protease YdiL (CAAX protease family)